MPDAYDADDTDPDDADDVDAGSDDADDVDAGWDDDPDDDDPDNDDPDNMVRLERIVARLPEARRVDVEAWDGEPTFRVRTKNFVFSDPPATVLSVKLPKEEATAVVATDPLAEPTGYGLGRHGWVTVRVGEGADDDRWAQVEEWVRTSYTLVAPKTLARRVLAEDGLA